MINLFSFAPKDASLGYLTQIFGTMNGILMDPANPGGGGSITILGSMFKYFNSIVLTIGVLIVVYTTVVGIMKTAHEGEFMGKNWNNLWIPIRMVLGIGALIPTGSGYSTLQVIMMWVIVQGIGAADTIWASALGFADIFGSPYAQVNAASGVGASTQLNNLFKGLVCAATAEISQKDPTDTKGGGYYCSDTKCGTTSFEGAKCSGNTCTWNIGPTKTGGCGTLEYCNADSACKGSGSGLKCAVCKGQAQALQSVIPTMFTIAQQFAQADYQYRDFYANSGSDSGGGGSYGWVTKYCSDNNIPADQCCVGGKSPLYDKDKDKSKEGADTGDGGNDGGKKDKGAQCTEFPSPDGNSPQSANKDVVKSLIWPYGMTAVNGSNFLDTVYQQYQSVINGAIAGAGGDDAAKMKGELADAMETGWIFAGGYYYTLASMNNKSQKAKIPEFNVTAPDMSEGALTNYRNNYSVASILIGQAQGAGKEAGDEDGFNTDWSSLAGGDMGELGGAAGDGIGQMSGAFKGSLDNQTNTDPLARLQVAGMSILIAVEVLYPIFLVLSFLIGTVGSMNGWALGSGFFNPTSGGWVLMYFVLIPAIMGLFGIMISLGGLLGVYTPLIPYIVFTMGAIGWMIATIETMVAGPLVALGILSPSGQHEIMGKAEPALMLLFNVFLRPTLMIFGLIAAMKLAGIVTTMINAMFWTVMTSIGTLDILGLIFFLAAYVFLIIAALNKCFTAIHVIPERVMTWIGGQAISYGEGEGLAEVKRGGESAMGGAQSAAASGQQQTKSYAKHQGKRSAQKAAAKNPSVSADKKEEEGP